MFYIVLGSGLVVGTASVVIYATLVTIHKARMLAHGWTEDYSFDDCDITLN
jgi:hypothetical protein